MSQSEIKKLIPALRVTYLSRYRNLRNHRGPEGRLEIISKNLSCLFKEERIQIFYEKGDEVRGYAERLIGEAIMHGDLHKPTMEIAKFYLKENQLIHKLFKVIVPRYKDSNASYTNLFMAPVDYKNKPQRLQAILELKGNPFPPLVPERVPTQHWIQNILLYEAKREAAELKERKDSES